MWKRADTRTLIACVPDAARRKQLARYIEHVVFFDHEVMWPSANYSCPEYPNVRTVQLYGTLLCASGPSQLVPFLSPHLRDLSIWTQSDEAGQPMRRHGDNVWVSRLRATCTSLSVLTLEATLDITSAELATMFSTMSQIERLRLGHELNPVLGSDSLAAVFALPSLKHLSLDCPFHAVLMQDLIKALSLTPMLPAIKKLDVTFEINDSIAAAILLENLGSLEELTITFKPTAESLVAALHPSVFTVIATLTRLTILNLYLPATILVPCRGIAMVAAMESLRHLNIFGDRNGFPQSYGHVHLTGVELLSSPISLKFLEALESLSVASPIQITHDEATAIIHKVTAVSHNHIHLFDLVVDETTSFGWPSAEDWQALWDSSEPERVTVEQDDLIWKATSRAFAPDPRNWAPRELDMFFKKNGEKLRLEDVASDDSYIHIS